MFKSETPVDIVNCLENLRPLDKFINNIKKDNLDDLGYKIIDKYKTYLKDQNINKNKIRQYVRNDSLFWWQEFISIPRVY